jgi:hypothetical protein
MRKRSILALAVLTALVFALSGCGDSVRQAAARILSGNVTGEVGITYGTEWFEFTVHSIDEVAEYAGYAPEDGYLLYDVLITEKNTYDAPIPMGTPDFYMDAESFDGYTVYPLDPMSDEMMPLEFELAEDESAEYHMVYEVPEDAAGLKLVYVEVGEDDYEGVTFNIPIN